ncbi:MAG: transketolase C-terminal domain-containing protein, partial [Luteibaculum sp.]
VPEEYYNIPAGKAKTTREGNKIAVITYGWPVHWANNLADELGGNDLEVLDLRTLVPLDWEAVFAAVKKCAKAIVLQEDTQSFGVASEIAARIQQDCFYSLDAPVVKIGSLDTAVPFAGKLEQQFLPQDRFKAAVENLLKL